MSKKSVKAAAQAASNAASLIISIPQDQTILSPEQKKFNRLLGQIETQRQKLLEWQQAMSSCQLIVNEKLEPARKNFAEFQSDLVKVFDATASREKLSKSQYKKIAHLIAELCEELITQHDRDDLKPIYQHYSGIDFDKQAQAQLLEETDIFKGAFEQVFGVDMSDENIDLDAPDLQERLAEKLRQAHGRQAARPRKKSAQQQKREAREQEDAAQASKSIREVYRQLVAALHPDREPDPLERDRKTELMKQVTVAYDKKDLLCLLNLQLQVEQIDQSKINSMADDRLRHFNKILGQQLQELQAEVMAIENNARMMSRADFLELVTPKRFLQQLKRDLNELRAQTNEIQIQVKAFEDLKLLKSWLNRYRIPQYDDDFPFF